ncbi:helix-turn-helix transcriptional regulator [Acidiphilium multivorum]|uniref:helix-turn-helix domain-containing protein n=1 Tax=Acidiphilium multivorum TaxID=62140 RepID=UPI0030C694A9|nr:helix-turn-helix transcriptional regulator [Acidiphilium multivorum]
MRANEVFAWNLRRIRVSQGTSQENLAIDAALDRTYVSRIERGFENPSLNTIERLAGALNVELTTLLTPPSPGAPRPSGLLGGRKARK